MYDTDLTIQSDAGELKLLIREPEQFEAITYSNYQYVTTAGPEFVISFLQINPYSLNKKERTIEGLLVAKVAVTAAQFPGFIKALQDNHDSFVNEMKRVQESAAGEVAKDGDTGN